MVTSAGRLYFPRTNLDASEPQRASQCSTGRHSSPSQGTRSADRLNTVRLAWFSPWPPQKSGVGGRSIDATRALAARGFAIDVFVDQQRVPGAPPLPDRAANPGEVRVQPAHDFLWRHHHRQHDLAIYQVGNSTDHAFIWPYLLRYPGLTVLHDARLHHARGKALIRPASAAPYRTAFAFDHPDVDPDVAELAVAGFDGAYYALWPMVRSVVLASRAVGVHTRGGPRSCRRSGPMTSSTTSHWAKDE